MLTAMHRVAVAPGLGPVVASCSYILVLLLFTHNQCFLAIIKPVTQTYKNKHMHILVKIYFRINLSLQEDSCIAKTGFRRVSEFVLMTEAHRQLKSNQNDHHKPKHFSTKSDRSQNLQVFSFVIKIKTWSVSVIACLRYVRT